MAGSQLLSSQWWSIPQAIVWVVTRDESATAEAAAERPYLASLLRPPRLRPVAVGNLPPFTIEQARNDVVRHACSGRLHIRGRERGQSSPGLVPCPQLASPKLSDRDGSVTIEDLIGHDFWSDLWVQASDCRSLWEALKPVPRGGGRPDHAFRAAQEWLKRKYPNGLPQAVKRTALVAEAEEDGVKFSAKVLRRALSERA